MPVGHRTVNQVVGESVNPHLVNTMSIGKSGITSREEVKSNSVKTNTHEELLANMELSEESQAEALKNIARYNELCDQGEDVDFNKMDSRFTPIKTAPFYASKVSAVVRLVCIDGLKIDFVRMNIVDTKQLKV